MKDMKRRILAACEELTHYGITAGVPRGADDAFAPDGSLTKPLRIYWQGHGMTKSEIARAPRVITQVFHRYNLTVDGYGLPSAPFRILPPGHQAPPQEDKPIVAAPTFSPVRLFAERPDDLV